MKIGGPKSNINKSMWSVKGQKSNSWQENNKSFTEKTEMASETGWKRCTG